MAKSPLSFRLTCTATTGVDADSAGAVCAALATALANAGWEDVAEAPNVAMVADVLALKPTSQRLTLTLTTPDGRTHQIDRALSASDSTISPAMQARFLQNLVAAIPSDF